LVDANSSAVGRHRWPSFTPTPRSGRPRRARCRYTWWFDGACKISRNRYHPALMPTPSSVIYREERTGWTLNSPAASVDNISSLITREQESRSTVRAATRLFAYQASYRATHRTPRSRQVMCGFVPLAALRHGRQPSSPAGTTSSASTQFFITSQPVQATYYASHDLTGFFKSETRASRMELRRIAVTEVAQEV